MKKNEVPYVLEQWSFHAKADPYAAPEVGLRRIMHGIVYGHPRHDDGKRITTSYVVSIGKFREGDVVETRNSRYLLGEMDPKFRAWYEGLN